MREWLEALFHGLLILALVDGPVVFGIIYCIDN